MTATRGARPRRNLAAELTLLQLRSVPLFGGCDESQLADVAAVSGERRFEVGDTIAQAGTVVRDVPIVLDGYAGAEIDARPAVQRGVKVLAELRKPIRDEKEREILFGKTQYERR